MAKKPTTHQDRPEHKPIDPGRRAARESRGPGKHAEPRRSEPDATPHRKDAGRD